MKRISTVIIALVLGSVSIFAAQDSTRVSPFHLSFVTPLGTNGLQSWNTTNLVSVNILAGFSGGLNGVEFAGFANALKGDMNGIQFAGFCNNTFGEANGMEIAGFWNFNRGKLIGMQLAGFANVAIDTVKGLQGSGFANVTNGDMDGVQAAGFANITTGTQKGLQASGFFNYARKLHGVQLGVVNVADTVEKGLPIGFFSFVRNGYKVVQLGGNETLYGEVAFKTGTKRFYNIFAVGATVRNNTMKWGWGYGIGTIVPVGRRMDLSFEGVSYHINEDGWFTGHLNMLNRLNLSLCWNMTRTIGIYAGPSLNVWVTEGEYDEGWHHHRADVSMNPGFTAGLRVGF